jgi:hypothetical protein
LLLRSWPKLLIGYVHWRFTCSNSTSSCKTGEWKNGVSVGARWFTTTHLPSIAKKVCMTLFVSFSSRYPTWARSSTPRKKSKGRIFS